MCLDLSHLTSTYLYRQDLSNNYKCISGELQFDDGTTVVPTPGKLVIFTGGAENVHWLDRVTAGLREAITLFWTCDTDYEIEL